MGHKDGMAEPVERTWALVVSALSAANFRQAGSSPGRDTDGCFGVALAPAEGGDYVEVTVAPEGTAEDERELLLDRFHGVLSYEPQLAVTRRPGGLLVRYKTAT
jgi:hypothetical protein